VPIKSDVISDCNLFLARATGKVNDTNLVNFQSAIVSVAGFKPTLNFLIDARAITENTVSSEGMLNLSADTPFDVTIKRAFVVSDEKTSILATLYATTTTDSEHFYITYNLNDACDWLDVDYEIILASTVYQDSDKL